MGSLVLREDVDGWTRLTPNRPDGLTALTVGMFSELRGHVLDLQRDDDVRFGDTHAKWALTPVWGMSQRLPRRVGTDVAERLLAFAGKRG